MLGKALVHKLCTSNGSFEKMRDGDGHILCLLFPPSVCNCILGMYREEMRSLEELKI